MHSCLTSDSGAGMVVQGCQFLLFSGFFSVIFGPIRSLYFLLFHLSLSELSVSFCVHFL